MPSSLSDFLDPGTSRFQEDFTTLGTLGRGAYGKVMKVRNNLDGSPYAVKCILLSGEDVALDKMLREVKAMSRLMHRNIVRYYASWLEHIRLEDYEDEHDLEEGGMTEGWTQEISTMDDGTGTKSSLPSSVDEVIQGHPTSHDPLQQRLHLALYIQMELCNASLYDYLRARDEYLVREAKSVQGDQTITALDLVSSSHNMTLFREVVAAIRYLHHKGLLHRDLKPGNVFLSWDGEEGVDRWVTLGREETLRGLTVKVGDFGLVKYGGKEKEDPSRRRAQSFGKDKEVGMKGTPSTPHPFSSSSSTEGKEEGNSFPFPSTPPAQPPPPPIKADVAHEVKSLSYSRPSIQRSHTIGIGTALYAAPEQLHATPSDSPDVSLSISPASSTSSVSSSASSSFSSYDPRVDIYALGIILMELYHPFTTLMERSIVLTSLREDRVLPDKLLLRWPKVAALILWMTAPDRTLRPTADQVFQLEWLQPSGERSSEKEGEGEEEEDGYNDQREGMEPSRMDAPSLRLECEALRLRVKELEERLSRCTCKSSFPSSSSQQAKTSEF